MASQRQLHAAFTQLRRRRRDECSRHPLKTRVGIDFAAPHRDGPTLLFSLNCFVVPVRALHETHGDLPPRLPRPVDDALCIIVARAQVRLHGDTRLKIILFARAHEEFKREVFERELLHVEVHEDALALGGFENRPDVFQQSADRSLGVDWIDARRQRTDLDRHIRSRDRAEVIGFQSRIRAPRRNRLRKILDQIKVFAAIRVSLIVTHACLAEQVD